MLFVYGTGGDAAENAWAQAKARYDAETFWYRGNGAVDIIPDTSFSAEASAGRSVVLYGNAETNRAWTALLAESPVVIGRGFVAVGDRRLEGADLACLLVRPRADDERACVVAIGGSGIAGMRSPKPSAGRRSAGPRKTSSLSTGSGAGGHVPWA